MKWVYCPKGKGYMHENDSISSRERHFKENSVGVAKQVDGDFSTVWLIGSNETWDVLSVDVINLDVLETGDKCDSKYVIFVITYCL